MCKKSEENCINQKTAQKRFAPKRKISFLAAFSKNGVIGSGGKIPWDLKTERNRFKQICNNKKVIMGRTTFEEIGHALPYCTIIIISRTLKKPPEKCLLAHSLEQAFSFYKENEEILVAGGGTIYNQLMEETSKIYATEIQQDFQGDVFFPKIDYSQWKQSEKTYFEENKIRFCYFTLTRII